MAAKTGTSARSRPWRSDVLRNAAAALAAMGTAWHAMVADGEATDTVTLKVCAAHNPRQSGNFAGDTAGGQRGWYQ